jgi:hypothetical protein
MNGFAGQLIFADRENERKREKRNRMEDNLDIHGKSSV